MTNTYPFPEMEKIYANADEKDLRAVIVYPDEDRVLYFDKAFTKPVFADDLSRLFDLGLLIISQGEDIMEARTIPVSKGFDVDGVTYCCVGLLTYDPDDGSLVIKNYYSGEMID